MSNTCKLCKQDYSRSETIRIFGDVWWTPIYCSAQCYTDATVLMANKPVEPTAEKCRPGCFGLDSAKIHEADCPNK